MANVAVRDPFQEMRSFMQRAFDETLPGLLDREWPRVDRAATIPLNVWENEQGVTVEAWVPGFSRDEVDVTLENGKLSVRAEHAESSQEEKPANGRTYFIREVNQRVVSRSLLLGDSYDPDSVKGSLKDGVLHLEIQKKAAAQPRRVEIEG